MCLIKLYFILREVLMMQQFSFNNCTASIQYYQRSFRSHSVSINLLDKLKISRPWPFWGSVDISERKFWHCIKNFPNSAARNQEQSSRALICQLLILPLILQDQPFSHCIGKIAFAFIFLAGKSTFRKSPTSSLISKSLFDGAGFLPCA